MSRLLPLLALLLTGCMSPGVSAALNNLHPKNPCRAHTAAVYEAQAGVVPYRATVVIVALDQDTGRLVHHSMNVWRETDGDQIALDNNVYTVRVSGETAMAWATQFCRKVHPGWTVKSAFIWRESEQ